MTPPEPVAPPPAEARRGLTVEQMCALGFGVVFITTILVLAVAFPHPTPSQFYVFRVVLSLAAGGVGAIIPGFIFVEVSNFLRAGGAIAVFALVYLSNPPELIVGGGEFEALIQRAEAALGNQNHNAALQLFTDAENLQPDNWRPYHGIGLVRYAQGNYAAAAESLDVAFQKQGKKDGTILYDIGLVQDALGQYEKARDTFSAALDLLRSQPFANDVRFSRGLMSLLLWLRDGAPKDDANFEASKQDFGSALENQVQPQHWAYYHLACLNATRAKDLSLASEARRVLTESAVADLDRSVTALAKFQSVKAGIQKDMMRDLLSHPNQYRRLSSYPAACPAILDAIADVHRSTADVLAQL